MSGSPSSQKSSDLVRQILTFIDSSSGLSVSSTNSNGVEIFQSIDGKRFKFDSMEINEVLKRMDSDGKEFIQVNFNSGIKVLFTDTLVGFKPKETTGLDMSKLPKVVTTPDLLSVFEAIEESLSSDIYPEQEVELLKRVFNSILVGGELAGFELTFERRWLQRLVATKNRASA